MTVTVSPMPHAFSLADDFLSLEHWREYGPTSREYTLRTDVSVDGGNALWLGGSGTLRLARDTDLAPGQPAVFTLWVWADDVGLPPTEIRISDGVSVQTVLAANEVGMVPGWNRVISRITPPASWSHVDVRLFITGTRTGGAIARLRAMLAPGEAGAQ